MLESMPPGIWLSKISVSTPVMFDRNSLYRGRMPAKYFFSLSSLGLSSRVSNPVPSSISTRLSVGLWPGPRLSELMAVSTQSAPGFDGLHQADHRHAGGGVHVHVNAHVLARRFP